MPLSSLKKIRSDSCANCGIELTALSKCSKCKITCYCSRDCQSQHWKATPGHKLFCLPSSERVRSTVACVKDEAKCAICQENLTSDKQTTLECLHAFHSECAFMLVSNSSRIECPLCRSSISSRKKCTIYFQGVDVGLDDSVDDIEKFLLIKSAAYGGYDQCQMLLGLMFYEGVFVNKCLTVSFDWFKKAALQGNAYAQAEIGTKYYKGEGVKQNFNEAYEWYLKAAEKGKINAQHYVAMMLCNDQIEKLGVNNDTDAFRWFMKAAEQGEKVSQYNVGVFYESDGLNDAVESLSWFEKSANQGYSHAQFKCGCIYLEGNGVLKDISRAVHWYTQAAKQGHAEAEKMVVRLSNT